MTERVDTERVDWDYFDKIVSECHDSRDRTEAVVRALLKINAMTGATCRRILERIARQDALRAERGPGDATPGEGEGD